MFKQVVEVPKGIRYLGDQGWFSLRKFGYRYILNKQNPGCGFTEYCIKGPENVILCSPRKLLLKNKYEQHPNEVYLVRNEMEKDPNIDFDLNKSSNIRGKLVSKNDALEEQLVEDDRIDRNSVIYRRLYNEIDTYISNRYCCPGSGAKILVTYDSYRIVMDILTSQGRFDKFITVIDEFQSILHDARFKSNTELKFMQKLKKSPTSIFVSATPLLDEYLDDLSDFRDLPYYQLDWGAQDSSRVIKPDLKVSQMYSVNSKAKEIIQSYLDGNFESIVVMRNGQPIEIKSTEAVLYVNSVNLILNIIKNNDLTPDQVNILCADTEENKLKIKNRLGKGFNIGEIPLKGEPNKMFTFCTRTVYLGADFYSTCARTFVFSDSNSDSLAVDISDDLPQILGRQRDEDNPWQNTANFYYKTTADYRKMKKEDFDEKIQKKVEKTNNLLNVFYNGTKNDEEKRTLAEKYKIDVRNSNYVNDYVAVNRVKDPITKKIYDVPIANDLVRVNEKRAFRIQQIDYKDRFTVFASISYNMTPDDLINQEVSMFFSKYNSIPFLQDKLRYLCESGLSNAALEIVLAQFQDSDPVKSYYITLGSDKLYKLGYNVTRIKKELGIVTFSPEVLVNTIYSNFHVGEKYLLSNLKNLLSDLYYSISYKATPKAIDILNYFEVKEFKVTAEIDGVKKRVRGYELVSSKEMEFRVKLDLMNKGEL